MTEQLVATIIATVPGAEYEVRTPDGRKFTVNESHRAYWRLANVLDDIGEGRLQAEEVQA